MDIEAAIRALRFVAIDRLVGEHVGSDRLIQLGLEALLAGVDIPSLALLAGLTRAEEPQAQELFDKVTAELHLAPSDLPVLRVPRAWALIRWWAQLIVDGTLDVQTGGELINIHGSSTIPDAESELLRPLISALALYEHEQHSWTGFGPRNPSGERDAQAEVVAAARTLVRQLSTRG